MIEDGATQPEAPLPSQLDTTEESLGALLRRYGLHARKALGQHFLSDPRLLDKIVAAAELPPEANVLEVGAGPGLLTRRLAAVARRVVAIELDDRLVALLRHELAHLPNVTIVHGDILRLDVPALIDAPYAVVANLPYYITSAVLRQLLQCAPPPFRLVLTVQREVAQRIVAPPGQLSLLAVSVQFYGRPRIVTRIPAGAFVPPPQVDSAVLRIDTYERPPVDVPSPQDFFRVVRAGFGQRRKQLHNTLSAGLGLSAEQVSALLSAAGIAPARRAETLSLAEWAALTRALAELHSCKVARVGD
ncbi:MAG: 16S rRNA (adenine(1518)-N(6)/adenine(1519)-N(6))-dimethyltransferase RsmA [Anaerolineae bacterium]|nr:16S rRNA (adenine(1518)-N(6)/adenine(1519)-N(6))-dimethyltransferase RsmA [Anaerolineae bacterium]MDW8071462.1 16S rRNA (adenine(1518)-N(6)/adenine(1519)-N(6))-dimethyltransferase RsmA [Anaerolineae bacterium]